MRVVITGWALQSYLDLKHRHEFSDQEYQKHFRSDAERLKVFPNDPKFKVRGFWGQRLRATV